MRTDWYKGVNPDPNLFKLAELLGMANPRSTPTHGYTVAEKAPEVVTAPGVYFPATKGEVIPLESRQDGGDVEPINMFGLEGGSTSTGMMGLTPDQSASILQPTNISPVAPNTPSGTNESQSSMSGSAPVYNFYIGGGGAVKQKSSPRPRDAYERNKAKEVAAHRQPKKREYCGSYETTGEQI